MDNLITVTDVKTICLSKVTYDVQKFAPFVEMAELGFIKPFLGDDFYDSIRTQYLANNLSTDNAILVNTYLKKAHAWLTLHKALPFIQMDITNSGIQINNSEYASSGTDKQRGDLVSEAMNNGNTYLREAKKFLEADAQAGKYALYESAENISSDTTIIGGLILDTED